MTMNSFGQKETAKGLEEVVGVLWVPWRWGRDWKKVSKVMPWNGLETSNKVKTLVKDLVKTHAESNNQRLKG